MLTRNQYALYTNLKKRVNCSEKSTQTDIPIKKPKYCIEYEETTTDSDDYSEYSDDDENQDLCFVDSNNPLIKQINKAIHAELKKQTHGTQASFIDNLNDEEFEYFNSLSKDDQATCENTYNTVINYNNINIPLKFRILNQTHSTPYVQQLALKKYQILQNMEESKDTNGEYHKLNNWLRTLCCVPFGNVVNLPVDHKSSNEDVVKFISSTKEILNKSVYGHDTTKDQIIRIIAQLISNPSSKGNVIGIHGDPGVGKTTLIKDGVCKALKLPFASIPLGGAGDSSYLEGHSYTYEGSSHGKIVDVLIQSKCMNPVLYFDELDKLSESVKGTELNNILIHITDPAQNENFTDKYFSGIPFDLSKCIIIFTYNNIAKIDPILLDRMITIHAKSYTSVDKVNILKNYLLPYMISQFNLSVQIDDDTILYLINKTDPEPGVRNLKRSLEKIMSNLNLEKYTNDTISFSNIKITNKMIDMYIEKTTTLDVISHLYT